MVIVIEAYFVKVVIVKGFSREILVGSGAGTEINALLYSCFSTRRFTQHARNENSEQVEFTCVISNT
jgi:hypothetical protein